MYNEMFGDDENFNFKDENDIFAKVSLKSGSANDKFSLREAINNLEKGDFEENVADLANVGNIFEDISKKVSNVKEKDKSRIRLIKKKKPKKFSKMEEVDVGIPEEFPILYGDAHDKIKIYKDQAKQYYKDLIESDPLNYPSVEENNKLIKEEFKRIDALPDDLFIEEFKDLFMMSMGPRTLTINSEDKRPLIQFNKKNIKNKLYNTFKGFNDKSIRIKREYKGKRILDLKPLSFSRIKNQEGSGSIENKKMNYVNKVGLMKSLDKSQKESIKYFIKSITENKNNEKKIDEYVCSRGIKNFLGKRKACKDFFDETIGLNENQIIQTAYGLAMGKEGNSTFAEDNPDKKKVLRTNEYLTSKCGQSIRNYMASTAACGGQPYVRTVQLNEDEVKDEKLKNHIRLSKYSIMSQRNQIDILKNIIRKISYSTINPKIRKAISRILEMGDNIQVNEMEKLMSMFKEIYNKENKLNNNFDNLLENELKLRDKPEISDVVGVKLTNNLLSVMNDELLVKNPELYKNVKKYILDDIDYNEASNLIKSEKDIMYREFKKKLLNHLKHKKFRDDLDRLGNDYETKLNDKIRYYFDLFFDKAVLLISKSTLFPKTDWKMGIKKEINKDTNKMIRFISDRIVNDKPRKRIRLIKK